MFLPVPRRPRKISHQISQISTQHKKGSGHTRAFGFGAGHRVQRGLRIRLLLKCPCPEGQVLRLGYSGSAKRRDEVGVAAQGRESRESPGEPALPLLLEAVRPLNLG